MSDIQNNMALMRLELNNAAIQSLSNIDMRFVEKAPKWNNLLNKFETILIRGLLMGYIIRPRTEIRIQMGFGTILFGLDAFQPTFYHLQGNPFAKIEIRGQPPVEFKDHDAFIRLGMFFIFIDQLDSFLTLVGDSFQLSGDYEIALRGLIRELISINKPMRSQYLVLPFPRHEEVISSYWGDEKDVFSPDILIKKMENLLEKNIIVTPFEIDDYQAHRWNSVRLFHDGELGFIHTDSEQLRDYYIAQKGLASSIIYYVSVLEKVSHTNITFWQSGTGEFFGMVCYKNYYYEQMKTSSLNTLKKCIEFYLRINFQYPMHPIVGFSTQSAVNKKTLANQFLFTSEARNPTFVQQGIKNHHKFRYICNEYMWIIRSTPKPFRLALIRILCNPFITMPFGFALYYPLDPQMEGTCFESVSDGFPLLFLKQDTLNGPEQGAFLLPLHDMPLFFDPADEMNEMLKLPVPARVGMIEPMGLQFAALFFSGEPNALYRQLYPFFSAIHRYIHLKTQTLYLDTIEAIAGSTQKDSFINGLKRMRQLARL